MYKRYTLHVHYIRIYMYIYIHMYIYVYIYIYNENNNIAIFNYQIYLLINRQSKFNIFRFKYLLLHRRRT